MPAPGSQANKVSTGIALLRAIAAIGAGVGLPLGRVLVDGPGYHSIFWLAAVIGVLAAITTHLFVPESPVRTPSASTSPARRSLPAPDRAADRNLARCGLGLGLGRDARAHRRRAPRTRRCSVYTGAARPSRWSHLDGHCV
jgi:MFS family permease